MNILGCLDRPSSGQFWLDGQEMSRLTPNQRALVRTEKIGFVFQSFNLLPRTTALHNVVMPLDYARTGSPQGGPPTGRQSADRVGLADRSTTNRRRCRAGSNSGWPSPGRWSTALR